MKKHLLNFTLGFIFMITFVACTQEEKPPLENNQIVIETERQETKGDFVYSLVTQKSEYIENEPIKIYAELEYIGDKEKIEIYHAVSPFYFPMIEKTRDFEIEYNMNQPLVSTTLVKGVPIREDYIGSGGYGSEDPREYVNFIKQISKGKFPKGEYTVNGYANFFVLTEEKSNEKRKYNIEGNIEFKVKGNK